jgi:hypothetical protein
MAEHAPHPDIAELIPTERVAVVLWRIYGGERLNPGEIAGYVGISRQGVHAMMGKISRVTPVECASDGYWQRASTSS